MATNIVQMTDGTGNKQYPVTSAEAVGMPDGSGNLTNYLDKRVTEYNVSVLHPTSGSGGSNKYTLETAIAQVPSKYRSVGLKCSFLNEKGIMETWEWIGGSWSVERFARTGYQKIMDIESSGAKPILRPVSVSGQTGVESISINRVTTHFLRTDDFDEVSYSLEYTNAQTVYFNDSEVPVKYIISDLTEGGKTIINKSYKYFKLSIKRVDNDTIDSIADNAVIFQLNTKYNLQKSIISVENDLQNIVGTGKSVNLDINGYITSTGSITDTASGNWVSSDYIDLRNEGFLIDVYLKGSSSGNVQLVTYYDASKKILPEYSINTNSVQGLIPQYKDAVFVRLSCASEQFGDYKPYANIKNSPFISHAEVSVLINEAKTNIFDTIFEKKTLSDIKTELGLIEVDGSDTFNGDKNWTRTEFMSLQGINTISYLLKSSSSEKLFIAYYEKPLVSAFISGEKMSGGAQIKGVIGKEQFPENAKYFRCSFKSATYGSYEPVLDVIGVFESDNSNDIIADDMIFPKNVYLVCNSFENSVYSRNTSPAVYLDHMFKSLNKEYNIRFSDGGIKRIFNFRAASDASWNPILNSDNDVDIFDESLKITGDIEDTTFTVKVHSTKSTVGKDKVARVLVIGSSTVYGEGATYLSNGIQKVKPYHAICYELFKKDNVEQNGGNLYFPLGTLKHANLSFTFNEETYNYDDYHEGRRGQNIQQTIESTDVFLDENGSFSLKAWLANYRTLTDKGERLYFGPSQQTTGTAGDNNKGYLEDGSEALDELGEPIYIGKKVSNTLSYNVCEPTHIVYHLGANGGGTQEQYEELIGYAQRDFPEVFIALVMNDSMGTIFPSQYQDADAAKCRWNLTDSRHALCYNIQKVYEHFDTDEYKQQKVYVLPFYFVSNPLFFSVRESNLPEYDYNGGETSKHLHPWGWLPTVHADVRAHSNYAYQLYAWIKYTFSL